MKANKTDLERAISTLSGYLCDEHDSDLIPILEYEEQQYPGRSNNLLWAIDEVMSAEFATGELGELLAFKLWRTIEANSLAGLDSAAIEWLTEFRKKVSKVAAKSEQLHPSDES